MVPDLALIEIFDFYMTEALDFDPFRHNREAWIILAHVCRKWRDIIFGSPYRLNVRLYFKSRRSVRAMLDIWPHFPIDILGSELRAWNVDNIVAALEHTDRIHKIELWDSSKFHLEQALAAMQKPFPSLTELAVDFFSETTALVVPDSLLSGSAPLLRSLRLRRIQFPLPLLQNLLLSATKLVQLRIRNISDSGFISPEAMVACLSALTKLEEFELECESPRTSTLRSRRLLPSTRCVLPALTSLRFNGSYEYIEDLVIPIDSPLLDNLDVIVFHRPELATPNLAQFVDRTPKLKALHEARIVFGDSGFSGVSVSLSGTRPRRLDFSVTRTPSDQLSVMTQLCISSFLRTFIPVIKQLYVLEIGSQFLFQLAVSQWLDLLGPFTSVEDLYLPRNFSSQIVLTLQGIVGEGMTELLPSLMNIFLEPELAPGLVEEAIGQFVAALCPSSRPIAVLKWDRGPWFQNEDQ